MVFTLHLDPLDNKTDYLALYGRIFMRKGLTSQELIRGLSQ
jgi:hypothetical protein